MSRLSTTSSTLDLLPEFGPEGVEARPPSASEAIAYCRRLARARQENFPVLSRLVPEGLVDSFASVYAFCRWADDLGDEHTGSEGDRARALHRLEWWRGLTTSWHRGEAPRHPVFVALSAARPASPLPLKPMLDLIDAFEQDQRASRYRTWEQLIDYCSRSANPVGRLVLALGGVPDADASPNESMPASRRRMLEQSDLLCTALQLTNFWQDVRRDLVERDRVYLPSEVTGLDEHALRSFMERSREPSARIAFIRALRPLVDRTRTMFEGARGLHLLVPACVARPVWLFHAAGLKTLERIETLGCTTLWRRPSLTGAEKAMLVVRASFLRGLAGGGLA